MADARAPAASLRHVTLLFVHGAGFCRQVWEPVLRRLRASPWLARAGVSFAAIDLPYHGANRDESVPPRVFYAGGSKDRPRVSHPGNEWTSWSSAAVYKAALELRRPGSLVVGVGHSMGAAALWKTETVHPGTFNGLVLFEPIYGPPHDGDSPQLDRMVGVTLQRASEWPSQQAAREHFMQWKNFAAWDRESLESWIEGAVVPAAAASTVAAVDPTPKAVLACSPAIEASMYCGQRLWLTDEELAAPKCRVVFECGARSRLVPSEPFAAIAGKFPEIYTARAPIAKLSHLLVMEDPALCADVVLADLEKLAVFPEASKL